MELGWPSLGAAPVGCSLEPALWLRGLDRVDARSGLGVRGHRLDGGMAGPATLLVSLGCWIFAGLHLFLRREQHGGLVVSASLLKELGGMAAGLDRWFARVSTHLDVFPPLGDFRLYFHLFARGWLRMVGSAISPGSFGFPFDFALAAGSLSGLAPADRRGGGHA